MIVQEGKVLELLGVPLNKVDRRFTIIEMDGAPFKVRTFYIGKDDQTKPTLLLIHGNQANFLGYFKLIPTLAEKYRVVGLDAMNLGVSTRSTSKACHKDHDTAEAWIKEYLTKTVNAFDLPDKFYLVGHSWGGYASMMITSLMPERISGVFMLSPAMTEAYDPVKYEARKKNMISLGSFGTGGPEDGLIAKKSEIKYFNDTYAAKKDPVEVIRNLPLCIQSKIWDAMIKGMEPMNMKSTGSKEIVKEFGIYYKM